MTKATKILTCIFIVLTFISAVVYGAIGGLKLKAATSLCFVVAGFVNLLLAYKAAASERRFALLMFCGLFFSFIGDIVINLAFVYGACIFALGHIFYVSAFINRSRFVAKDLIPACLLFALACGMILLYPNLELDNVMLAVCLTYAAIISLMAGKAVSNAFTDKSLTNFIFVAGVFLFFTSDAALLLLIFGNAGEIADTVCLYTYFPAQCLLAYGLHRVVIREAQS
ncbi:MAG: lysoplasmalogenase [Clostridia bacterium]|nr:lysoplasmalogenase [Clostridia bacterium]